VPFPHSIQDAEGIGIVGTADLAAVRAAVPRPWVPVQTNAVGGVLKAVWSTWKDIEHVNYLGEEGRDCQRQWIVFHVMHEDDPRANITIESPIQTLYAQFAGQHIHYLYNWKMYTDCHSDKMVRVDRELYGWDSEPATHEYQRDKKGNLDWTVRDGAGNQLMKLHASMPYGVPNLLQQLPALIKYGTAVGNPSTDLVPDRKAFQRFLTRDDLPFHWITKPGILDIRNSSTLMPVIYSPFSQWDVPKYPSTSAGNQWDSIHYSDEAYYPETGPFGVNSPMPETDYVDFTGNGDLQDFGMELTPDFSLVFYAFHFRMQWEAPWTFVPVKSD